MVLVVIVSQIYPVISLDENGRGMSSLEFWGIIFDQRHFNQLINVLFFGGLAITFIPLLNHPVFALPIQSGLSVALIFHWQFLQQLDAAISFLPGIGDLLKIIVYMAIAYYVTRELSIWVSERLDRLLTIEGSIHLVADAIYLVFQIPLIAIYCLYLKGQLPVVVV